MKLTTKQRNACLDVLKQKATDANIGEFIFMLYPRDDLSIDVLESLVIYCQYVANESLSTKFGPVTVEARRNHDNYSKRASEYQEEIKRRKEISGKVLSGSHRALLMERVP